MIQIRDRTRELCKYTSGSVRITLQQRFCYIIAFPVHHICKSMLALHHGQKIDTYNLNRLLRGRARTFGLLVLWSDQFALLSLDKVIPCSVKSVAMLQVIVFLLIML